MCGEVRALGEWPLWKIFMLNCRTFNDIIIIGCPSYGRSQRNSFRYHISIMNRRWHHSCQRQHSTKTHTHTHTISYSRSPVGRHKRLVPIWKQQTSAEPFCGMSSDMSDIPWHHLIVFQLMFARVATDPFRIYSFRKEHDTAKYMPHMCQLLFLSKPGIRF